MCLLYGYGYLSDASEDDARLFMNRTWIFSWVLPCLVFFSSSPPPFS
uniref:Uncharacterized protein n=1 Tax=Rhizophora mucronata TaxID=61149 RepID=A0A2P2IMR3_RHIMU